MTASSIYSSSRKHPVKREPSPKSGSGKAWKNSNNASASSTIEEDGFDEDITDKAVKSSNKEEEEEECMSLNALWETPHRRKQLFTAFILSFSLLFCVNKSFFDIEPNAKSESISVEMTDGTSGGNTLGGKERKGAPKIGFCAYAPVSAMYAS